MLSALGWGALAAGSLVIGALLAFVRAWPDRQIGLVLAFGAGALISAVSFELADEGVKVGGLGWTGLGLGLGAITYFTLDGLIERRAARPGTGAAAGDGGIGLALGAFLDGLPEQTVLGIGLATGTCTARHADRLDDPRRQARRWPRRRTGHDARLRRSDRPFHPVVTIALRTPPPTGGEISRPIS